MLQRLRIDRHIPFLSKRRKRADMIKMPVGQNDRRGPPATAKPCFGGRTYVRGGSRYTRVYKQPAAISCVWSTDKYHVHDRDLAIGKVERDLACFIVTGPIGFRVICRSAFG